MGVVSKNGPPFYVFTTPFRCRTQGQPKIWKQIVNRFGNFWKICWFLVKRAPSARELPLLGALAPKSGRTPPHPRGKKIWEPARENPRARAFSLPGENLQFGSDRGRLPKSLFCLTLPLFFSFVPYSLGNVLLSFFGKEGSNASPKWKKNRVENPGDSAARRCRPNHYIILMVSVLIGLVRLGLIV